MFVIKININKDKCGKTRQSQTINQFHRQVLIPFNPAVSTYCGKQSKIIAPWCISACRLAVFVICAGLLSPFVAHFSSVVTERQESHFKANIHFTHDSDLCPCVLQLHLKHNNSSFRPVMIVRFGSVGALGTVMPDSHCVLWGSTLPLCSWFSWPLERRVLFSLFVLLLRISCQRVWD